MKYALFIPLAATFLATSSYSQEPIYRCGNEYTNTKPTSEKTGCKLLEGSNVTVIQGTRPNATAPVRVANATQSSAPRIDSGDQKSRDSDARQILESELKRQKPGRPSFCVNTTMVNPRSRAEKPATTRSTWTAWRSSKPAWPVTKVILPVSDVSWDVFLRQNRRLEQACFVGSGRHFILSPIPVV